jgi:hypothetical protein
MNVAIGIDTVNVARILPRYSDGSQYVKYRMAPGKKPASAAPKMKRMAYNELGPITKAISPETMPQVIMMRAIHLRAPNL